MSTRYTLGTALAYIRRPYFPAGKDRVGEAQLKHLVQLLFFTLALAMVVGGLVGLFIAGASGEVPENVNQTLGESNPAQFLFMGVIAAPLLEEVIFRSWLGGRRACILGLPILFGLAAMFAGLSANVSPVIIFGIMAGLGVLIGTVGRQFMSLSPEGQKEGRWRLFPVAFYGSALIFALVHLANYEGGLSSPIMALAVLPQALVGLILGYVRMRFGLFHAIIFHAVYNLVLIGLLMTSQSVVPDVDPTAAIAYLHALTLAAFGAAP